MERIPGTPRILTELALGCRARGARALLVGGCVRDHLLGRKLTDWDVEVYGLEEAALASLLAAVGSVNAVGRSFGVYKVHRGGSAIDVALPRRDSKVGRGHRGIRVEGDPHMPPPEAARRRDLTINAMLLDPLTGELLDFHGGLRDLQQRRLRAVDPATFLEDPLRALRVVQFAARLCFEADPSLVALCTEAALDELPAERLQAEWVKLLLQGVQPSRGLAVARQARILERLFAQVAAGSPTDEATDRMAGEGRPTLAPEGRQLAAMLGAWLHPLQPGEAEAVLDTLGLHRWKGYPLRDRLLATLAHWRTPTPDDAALRHLSTQAELALVLWIRHATGDPTALPTLQQARSLGIAEEPPPPLLQGRDLRPLGFRPGPEMGEALRHVYRLQLDGSVTDRDGALQAARRWLEATA